MIRTEYKRSDFAKLERGKFLRDAANGTRHQPLSTTALGLAGMLNRPGKVAVSLKTMDKAVLDTAATLHVKAIAKSRASI